VGIQAVLCTLAVFVFLPFTEIVSRSAKPTIELRPVSSLRPPLPPPTVPEREVPRPEPVRAPRVERREARRPKLERPAPVDRAPLRLPVSLHAPTPDFTPDFELSFEVAAGPATEVASAPEPVELVFGLDEVDRPPRPLVRVPPVYPYMAERRRIEGFVELVFTVNRDGRVEDVEILASDPGDLFVEAARRAVSRWRFEPASKDGRPVAVRVSQTLRFEAP